MIPIMKEHACRHREEQRLYDYADKGAFSWSESLDHSAQLSQYAKDYAKSIYTAYLLDE